MKVKQIKQRGEPVWLVDGKINGKRKRMFFESEPKARQWLAAENKDTTCQQWWLDLSNADRVNMMNAFERSRSSGFTLLSAIDHFAVEGLGKKFLEKKTIGDAVGAAGKENRYAEEPEPSGFLGDKLLSGMPPHSLSTLKSALYSFAKFAGPDTQCSLITPALIKKWLAHPEHGGKLQKVTKAGNIGRLGQLCNWLIRQDVLKENPVLKLEKFNLDAFDPYVLTVDECQKILEMCRKDHFEMLPLLALNLFCGIRPAECRRLSSSKGRDGNFNWEDNEVVFQARKTKTKMRRFVEMSDNCLAWLNLQELNLPIANSAHKWNGFLKDAKKLLGYKTWPHDCLRHSFCSYGLRHSENAGKVALQAGNTEKVLFNHYLKLVSKAAAKEFWNIAPENAGTQFQVVAA
jgi:integrase